MNQIPDTELESHHSHLEKASVLELLEGINQEDQKIANAVKLCIPKIKSLVEVVVDRMEQGGRLFYIGSGTSGRLGVVDASECPPTFGVSPDRVIGVIAGGDTAIRAAVEHAEDDRLQAWEDLKKHHINAKDFVIGISASGKTPYVHGGLKKCEEHKISTGSITCSNNSEISEVSTFPIEVITGPEFVTGSTRMKAGTAQKLVLNMITTSTMIKLGHVKGNRMVDMQLTNHKLLDRGSRMIQEELGIEYAEAKTLLLKHGSVRDAIAGFKE